VGDRFRSFSKRLSVLLIRRTFSLWWGSNDELRGERYLCLNGICDEALGFDAFHGFAGRLEFGFAFVSDRGQASGVSEREECQHHVRIERDSRPPLNSGGPLTTMFGLPIAESMPRRASSQVSAWVGIVDPWSMCWEPRGDRRANSRGIIACYNKFGRRQNDRRMFVLIMPNPHDSALQSYGAMAQGLEQSRQVAMHAWPKDPKTSVIRKGSRLNEILVIKLDPGEMDEETRSCSADGIIAHSVICTQAGCPVSEWAKAEEGNKNVLKCPCHNSEFNPRESVQVMFGPVPRRLAALPLTVADGSLIVAATFVGKVGAPQLG
jgi:Rieske Fe-S protein